MGKLPKTFPDKLNLKLMNNQATNSIAKNVFDIANTLLNAYSTESQQAKIDAEKESFLNDNPNIIKAVYPCIVDEAFAITMGNYRKFIAEYNFKTSQENLEIQKWNENYCTKELTEIEKTFTALFYKNYSHLKPKEYNQKIEEFWVDKNILLEKKAIQSVKYATELIFSAILSAYNAQLINQNSEYMKLLVAVERPISPMKLNSWFITQMKRNGVQALDLCTKTVRNHRNRLFEAGVLTARNFKGSKSPVECYINPEILTVLDFKNNQLRNTKNQPINFKEGKNLPDNDVITRAFKEEKEMKENGKTDFLSNMSSGKALTITYFNTSTPVRKQQKKTEGRAGENVNFSENLLRTLENEQVLAEKLAQNHYSDYRSIDIRYLTKEAYEGTLTNEEFVQVVIQDFFKSSNKLWKNSPNVYVGSWKIAINQYLKSKFRLFSGNPMQKVNILEDIQELRWRLEFARKWYLQNEKVQILYPNNYFDFTRTKSFEIGFEHTKEKYKNHLKKLAKEGQSKVKAEAKAKRRALTYKYNVKINQFLNNKIDYGQLKKYVQDNLPKEFNQNLSINVNKLLNEHNQLEHKKQLEQKYNNIQYNINEF